jgi:hypothetical protein
MARKALLKNDEKEQTDEPEETSIIDDEPQSLERVKKPRSEAQLLAFNKMIEARKNKAKVQLEDKAKREEVLKNKRMN